MSSDKDEPGDGGLGAAAKEARGKVREKWGWATADRETEAKGRVDQEQAAVQSGQADDADVASVDQAEDQVRRANEEID